MQNILVRKGSPKDADHFSSLVILTSPHLMPTLFGSKVKEIMRDVFRHRRHYYSFDRSFFVEVDGKIAGMAQLHKLRPRRRETTRLSFLLFKYLNWRFPTKIFNLLRAERMIKAFASDECYLSNVAVYPEFRSLGLGTRLLERVEEEARSIGKKKILLHAETSNVRAISLYQRLGYKMKHKMPSLMIKNRLFQSFIAVKPIV